MGDAPVPVRGLLVADVVRSKGRSTPMWLPLPDDGAPVLLERGESGWTARLAPGCPPPPSSAP